MENFFGRYRNQLVLGALMFTQVIALATQVKRSADSGAGPSTRLVRYWAVASIAPLEKLVMNIGHGSRSFWASYVDLRGVHDKNRELSRQIDDLRLQQSQLAQDAGQAHRLQTLLDFKQKTISRTVAAQVIGSGGNDQSHLIMIDKGRDQGLREDMPVISPDGVIGKLLRVYAGTSQVLEINDASSGVGAILEKSRLQGIANGTSSGSIELRYIMADEQVSPGEQILTSGGDRIFPKGLVIGTVDNASVGKDREAFLDIRVKPAVALNKLEEVLVITKMEEVVPEPAPPLPIADGATEAPSTGIRAADILAQRLPSAPPVAPENGARHGAAGLKAKAPGKHPAAGARKTEAASPAKVPADRPQT